MVVAICVNEHMKKKLQEWSFEVTVDLFAVDNVD